MPEDKILEKAALGYLVGTGVDALMEIIAKKYIPQLTKPSPLKLPGYAEHGVHYDDLITLGAMGAIAAKGAIDRDREKLVMGVSGLLGAYIYSTVLRKGWSLRKV